MSSIDTRLQTFWRYLTKYHTTRDDMWLTMLDSLSECSCPVACKAADKFLNGTTYERLTG
jgi:hypothetical protein